MIHTLRIGLAAGLVTAIITGSLLFSVHAVKYAGMGIFQLKLGLLAAAILNALLLHCADAWAFALAQRYGAPPARLRAAAAFSILLWGGVIICGRMIAYYA